MEETLLAEVETRCDDAERALVDRAVAGDVQAFAALYDRHLERVHRYVFYLVGNRADAEDLTQQVFMNAWRAASRYRHTGASTSSFFGAWLIKIAHNVAMSFFRQAKDARTLDVELASGDRWADPEAEALARQDRLAVRRAILRLKPEQQQVIVMRFVEHFDYSDIAAAIGKSEGNVRVIQHRALAELRRMLSNAV